MTTSIAMLAVVVTGLMVGVELAVAAFLNPLLDRLPNDAGLQGRVDGARILGKLMPLWYAASLVLCIGVSLLAKGDTATWAAAAAAAFLIVSIVMSVSVLVPINNRIKTWTQDHRPHDWRDQLQRWNKWHYARAAVIIAGFACLAASTVTS